MCCGGRLWFLLLPWHLEIARSVLSQQRTWTVVDSWKCCGTSWDITTVLQLNVKCSNSNYNRPWDWKTEILHKDVEVWCHQPLLQTSAKQGQEEQGGASSLGCWSPNLYWIGTVITWTLELRRQIFDGYSHSCQVVANLPRSYPFLERDLDYHVSDIFIPFIWDLKKKRKIFKLEIAREVQQAKRPWIQMDDQGWISEYINSPAELLRSFKFLCCGFVCLHRSTHTSWTMAAYSVLTSAVETRQLSNNKDIPKNGNSQLHMHIHVLWAGLKPLAVERRATRTFVT